MDEHRGHYAKWNKPDAEIKKKAWSHLYVKSSDIKYGETESEMVVSRGVEVGETRRCQSEGTKLQND